MTSASLHLQPSESSRTSMADEFVLLDYWLRPFGMWLRITLALKGSKYEHKEEDLTKKSPLLLQSNPVHMKIPVLIHNGKPVSESVVALQYIDVAWNDTGSLFPSDPYVRSQARFWVDFVDSKIYGYVSALWTAEGEELEAIKRDLLDCITLLEGELGDKPFFGSEALGMVDAVLLPFASWFSVYNKFGDSSLQAACPMFIAWLKRCFRKESVSESLPAPEKLYDYFMRMKKKLGTEVDERMRE